MDRVVKVRYMVVGLGMWCLFSGFSFPPSPGAANLKLNGGMDFNLISNGESKFIDVGVDHSLVMGDAHILLVVVRGSGKLEITMEKSDIGGQLILMTGVATSSDGRVSPIFKTGFTPNALSEAVEIGDEEIPDGFLFLISGVLFSLGGVGEEGEYSIELAF